MKDNNINPNEVVSRALLLMKYDTKKTLTENEDKIKPVLKESQAEDVLKGTGVMVAGTAAGAAAGAAAGGAAYAGGAVGAGLAFSDLASFGTALANPVGLAVGVPVVALTGIFLYQYYRNADNEGVLRKTMEACSTVEKYGKEDDLMKEAALDKETHLKIAQMFYQGVHYHTGGISWFGGTDEEMINKGAALLKNANVADICGVIYEYQGEDMADDLAEDLNEYDLAPIVTAFKRAASKYAGGGIKVIPENSYNRKFYQEKFPCIYQNKGVVMSSVKIDQDGYTYVIVKGSDRKTTSGKIWQRYYRLYADGEGRLMTASKTDPKPTNARLACVAGKPVGVVVGSSESESGDVEMSESLYETYLRKNGLLKEGFDDTKVKVDTAATVEEDLEGWEDGKKVAPWNVWLKKFGCLKAKFPTGPAVTDPQGYTYFVNLNPKNNKKYRFYSDGEIWNEDGSKYIGQKWSCSKRGEGVIVEPASTITEQIAFDIPGETDVKPEKETGGGGGGGTTPLYKSCTSFPMAKGCMSDKIKEVQACLGVKTDGKLGNETISAMKSKNYGETLDQVTYDKIKSECSTTTTTTASSSSGGGSTNDLLAGGEA